MTPQEMIQNSITKVYDEYMLSLIEDGMDPGAAAEKADTDLLRVLNIPVNIETVAF